MRILSSMESAQNKAVEESSSEYLKPLDRAIQGIEAEFEEEIGLYQTFGGD